MQQRITVNGKAHVVEATADMSLLHVLRDELELDGPKYGCGKAQCGACMVHIAGQPTLFVCHADREGERADHHPGGIR